VATLTPIVVVPGLGGSVLEAKLTNRPPFLDCQRNTEWYTIWASLIQGVTRHECWKQNFQVVKDGDGVGSAPGVTIRPRDFGNTGGIEYSNAGTQEPKVAYMHKLVSKLEGVGYTAGVNLRAATNDFRLLGAKAPNGTDYLDLFFTDLKQLVEDTSKLSNYSKVHLLSHSLGGPTATVFLSTFVDASWKETYIASHIMLSAPLLGTPVAIEGMLSGPMYDWVPQFLPELVVPLIRTFPSILWMWPRILDGVDVWAKDEHSSGEDRVFVSTPTQAYSLRNLTLLAKAVNATLLEEVWNYVNTRTQSAASDPGVSVLCIYANDTHTDLHVQLPDDKFQAKGKVVEVTWGDGTVNLPSLAACSRWKDTTVRTIQFGGSLAAHTEIVQNDEVIQDIINWVSNERGF
jgi:lysophospholipase-3